MSPREAWSAAVQLLTAARNIATGLSQAAVYNLRLNKRPRWKRLERLWWVTEKIVPIVLRTYVRAWQGEGSPSARTRG